MSFSFGFTTPVADIAEAVDAAVERELANAAEHGYVSNLENARALGVIELAKAHAAAAATAIARPGDSVSVSISGHANPSPDPEPGWASNMLTVSVSQMYGEAQP